MPLPNDLRAELEAHGQGHLAEQAHGLSAEQLRAIDLPLVARLFAGREAAQPLPERDKISPPQVIDADQISEAEIALGREALERGELAVILVAGGQGTRLGFDAPKGCYPVGPVSGATLFALHARKVLALRRRHGKPVLFLIMTSDATDAATREYFAAENYFGLPADEVIFFRQGTMPAVDLATGRILIEKPGAIALSPDGHGGTLKALDTAGLLELLQSRGVKHLFYFQVDNPLVKVGDAAFLGAHVARRSEASSKCIDKIDAAEKMGVFVDQGGRCAIIEYSDLPKEMAEAIGSDGELLYRAGSPAIHLFDLAFLRRVAADAESLPFHYARKKVPHLHDEQPERENALKFERFIFDLLPLADRWLLVRERRDEEFMPLKNATGADSPETVRLGLIAHAKRQLEDAGCNVMPGIAVEVSPLFDREFRGGIIAEATYFE